MNKLPPDFTENDWRAYAFEALTREGRARPDEFEAEIMARRVKDIRFKKIQPYALACATDEFFAGDGQPCDLLTTSHLAGFLRRHGRRPEWLWRFVWLARKVSADGARFYCWWLRRCWDGDADDRPTQRKLIGNLRQVAAQIEGRPDIWAVNWLKEERYGKEEGETP